MDDLGLFPLGLVLFPTERIPLHIFEPRYRELISECVEEERDFGIVLAEGDALSRVGTRARVAEVVEVLDDGRMNVVVEGGERFLVSELTEGRSFHTAAVEPYHDEDDVPDEADVESLLDLYAEVAELTSPLPAGQPPAPPEGSSFAVGALIDFGNELKQELLELRSERRRVARMNVLLRTAVDALRSERLVRDRAEGNGRVSPVEG